MTKKDKELKELLDIEVNFRNNIDELSQEKPDPLLIAKKYKDEYISLICALFAYGKASLIIKFLEDIDVEALSAVFILAGTIITSTVKIIGGIHNRVPVKTNDSIPKELNFKCMELLKNVELKSPVKKGDVVIKNIF